MRILKALTLLSLLTLILSSAVSAAAATDVNLPYTVLDTDGISIVPAGEGRVVLNGTLFNTRTKQAVNLGIGAKEQILDVKTLSNPDKIIVLTRSKEQKILKYSFRMDGKLQQKSFINIRLGDQGKAQWTPGTAGTPEKVWVQRDKLFSVYKAPWNQAEASFDSTYRDTAYEYSNVIDWRASSSPYLVLEYDGSVIMGSQRYIAIVNMNDKSQQILEIDQNPYLDLQITGNKLAVTTNWLYQAFPANVEHPDSTRAQPLLSLIDLPAAASKVILNGKFEEKYDTASGWKSELFGSQLYVKDVSAHSWSLYDLTGKSILSNQPAPPASGHEAHFIGWDTVTREASFAIFSSSSQISVVTLPLK
ncbi:hypothetical protein AMQ84_18890 [Paenibacillus riograndensis]|uniref:Uncharacterized protein n=1 Tax=Paenibacillus riograndensis TaxID=483937 RepID=A0A132TUG9_9BACL|nr:hypothetical protein [Paenibacillus riograndensis]KWX74932.1 hypothetical protein AMQ84_18890 [Paenibacillus riograndensis]